MDNNFNDNPEGQAKMPDMSENTGNAEQPEVKLEETNVQPQADMQETYTQPQADMQGTYTQPQTDMQGTYTQPQADMQGTYTQPQADMQETYTQPQADMQGMYAQPQADMQGMYAQPQAAATGGGSGKPPKQKKPLTKGKLAGIICGGVAAVALIVCGVIFLPKLFKSDKEVVLDAFEATFHPEGETSYFADAADMESIYEKIEESGGSMTNSLVLREAAGDAGVDGLSIDYGRRYDPVNKIVNYCLDIYHDDTTIYQMILTGDEDKTYFQIPVMFDGYFWLPNDGYFQALASSCFGEGLNGEDLPDFSVDHFAGSDGETADINSQYVNAGETIWDKTTFEKQGNAKVDVNGKTVKAKEYYITVSKEDIQAVISDLLSGLSEEISNNLETGMDAETMQSSIDQIQSILSSAVKEDLVIKVYIADKKVVKVTSENTLSMMGINLTTNFYVDIDDDCSGAFTFSVLGQKMGINWDIRDIKGNANGTVTVDLMGDKIEIQITATNEDKADSATSAFSATLSYNGEQYGTMQYEEQISKSDNSFTGSIFVEAEGETLLEGSYNGVVSFEEGKSYEVSLENFEMSTMGQPLVRLEGSFGADTESPSVIPIDESLPMYEMATMEESDFENIILDNEDNFTEWLTNIGNDEVGAYIEEIITNLVYGLSYGDDSYADGSSYDDGYSYDDGSDYSNEGVDAEDAVLVATDGTKVQILGTIEGYELSYACDYFVDYTNDEADYIEYSLCEGKTVDQLLTEYYMASDEAYVTSDEMGDSTFENNVATEVEGVNYSSISYFSYDTPKTQFTFAKEIAPGLCLVADITIVGKDRDDLDPGVVNELANMLNSQYYTILQ